MQEIKVYQVTEEEDRILREAAEKYPLGKHTKCIIGCTLSSRDKDGCCGCQDVLAAERYFHANIEDAYLDGVFELYGTPQKLKNDIASLEEQLVEKKKALKQAEATLKEHVVVVKKEGT